MPFLREFCVLIFPVCREGHGGANAFGAISAPGGGASYLATVRTCMHIYKIFVPTILCQDLVDSYLVSDPDRLPKVRRSKDPAICELQFSTTINYKFAGLGRRKQ